MLKAVLRDTRQRRQWGLLVDKWLGVGSGEGKSWLHILASQFSSTHHLRRMRIKQANTECSPWYLMACMFLIGSPRETMVESELLGEKLTFT